MFSGAMVATVTPFANGQVDEDAFGRLVDFQIDNGTDAIIPCGTTGESATLSTAEHKRVVEFVIEAVGKRVPVIAGTGSNNTAEAIEYTKHAKDAGADGALMIMPYYNKPTQEGLYQHFKTVAEAVDIPIIVYNILSRTGVNMLPATLARLAEIDNIVGVKEASGDLAQMAHIVELCGEDFDLLSGDDPLTLPLMAVGGKGVISVAANVVPGMVKELVSSFMAGDIAKSREVSQRLQPLVRALFMETNPIPVKMALGMMGMINDEMRLPMVPMNDENTAKLKKVLMDYGLVG